MEALNADPKEIKEREGGRREGGREKEAEREREEREAVMQAILGGCFVIIKLREGGRESIEEK